MAATSSRSASSSGRPTITTRCTPPSQSDRASRRTKDSPGPHGSSAFARPMRDERPAARITPGTMTGIVCPALTGPFGVPCTSAACELKSQLDDDRRSADAVSALWHADGDARPGAGEPLEAGSILGLPALRPAFLDDPHGPTPARCGNKRGGNPLKTGDFGGAPNPRRFLDFPSGSPYTDPRFQAQRARAGRGRRRGSLGYIGRSSAPFCKFAGRFLRPGLPRAQFDASP
jgi:hypothetical protein